MIQGYSRILIRHQVNSKDLATYKLESPSVPHVPKVLSFAKGIVAA